MGLWSRLREKASDAGDGFPGGLLGKVAFGVTLVLVVGGTICMTFWQVTRPEGIQPPENVWFLCTKCNHEWQVPRAELPDQDQPVMRPPPARDCPKCRAKDAGFAALSCPNCGKKFHSRFVRYTGQTRDVCPHCKTDFLNWYQQKK